MLLAADNQHNKERGAFIRTADNTTLPTMAWLEKEEPSGLELPEIGEHSSVILSRLGYPPAEVDRLLADRTVEQSEAKAKSKL
jgi:hypothetical protein